MNTRKSCLRRRAAFTLIEIMVTSMIALVIVGALMSSYMYGMRMFEVVKPKLATSDQARHTISKMITEVRSAGSIQIGTGSEGQFTPAASLNTRQQGNAIQIFPNVETTNTFIRYFRDDSDDTLRRISNLDTESTVMARDVTNAIPFTSEDFAGNVHMSRQSNRVIGLFLEFSSLPYTTGKAGPGALYDHYQLRTRITRR
jgi:Tfp pilus assembly protein PilW